MPIRVVLYHEGGKLLAHCLEFDLVGDGDSQDDAIQSLLQAIKVQVQASIDFKNWSNLFRPADPELFQLFAEGKDVAVDEIEFERVELFNIPTFDFREAEKYDVEDDELVCA